MDGVIFLIDGADWQRRDEVQSTMDELVDVAPSGVPWLILLNKIDSQASIPLDQWKSFLDFSKVKSTSQSFTMLPCSLVKRVGLKEGFSWLNRQLTL